MAKAPAAADLADVPESLRSSFAPKPVDVFPENWPALQVFIAMSTQWRVGMGGAYGLDYNVIPIIEQRLQLQADADTFQALRCLESEVLKLLAEQKSNGR